MKKFMNLFGRSSQLKEEQAKEIEYRKNCANIQRMIATQRKQLERMKNEAVALEAQGEHAKALSKASQLKLVEKRIQQAEQNLRICEATRSTAKEQKAWVEMANLFQQMGKSTLVEMDPDAFMAAQQKSEMVMTELEEMNMTMAAITEGITENTDMELHNAEGEAVLASLMEEKRVKEPVRLPEILPELPDEEDEIWNDKAHAMLAELGV